MSAETDGGTEIVSVDAYPSDIAPRIYLTAAAAFTVGLVVGLLSWRLAGVAAGALLYWPIWLVTRALSRSYPLRQAGRIAITTTRFVARRGRIGEEVAEQALVTFASHDYQTGWRSGRFMRPDRLIIEFTDGNRWRVSHVLPGGLASFVGTLDELVADD